MTEPDPRLIIEMLTSSLAGKRFTYETSDLKFGVKVGRAPDCDIRFDANRDIKVSSHHASIDEREEGVFVADAGSSNGLYLNGERVTAEGSQIFDGDEVSFGQTGATAKFVMPGDNSTRPTVQISAPDNEASPTETIDDDDAPRGELTRIVKAAGDEAGAGDKTRKMVKAVASAMNQDSERKRANLASKFSFALIALAVCAGVLVWQLNKTHEENRNLEQARIDKVHEHEKKLEKNLAALSKEASEREVRLRAESEADIKRLQDQLGEDVTTRLAEIEKERQVALKAYDADVKKRIEEASLSDKNANTPNGEVFKELTKQYNESVFLIYVEYPLIDRNGKQVGIEGGSGTGWLAKTSDKKAWIVTNKHVMMPFLFKPEIAISHAIRNVKPAPVKDWLISVWQPGTQLRPEVGSRRLSFSESWASYPKGKGKVGVGGRGGVRIKGIADNDMKQIGEHYESYLRRAGFPTNLPETIIKRIKAQEIHVMDTFKDLAILELDRLDATLLAKPIPMATGPELKTLTQLDPVLALGYPLGLSVIKSTIVTTSPVLGDIRNLQWDVSIIVHSAPIQPGNSGGPLIDVKGRVIGVTTRGHEATLSEAISVSHARALLNKLVK